MDESGAAEISAGTIVISRTGSPATPSRAKLGWRRTTLAVCEVLLTDCPATVSAVVAETGLSMSGVATALKFLASVGFLSSGADRGPQSRRRVTDRDGLIDVYAAAAERLRSPVTIRAGVLWRNPLKGVTEVGRAWDEAGIGWAATGALSAAAWAPIMTEVTPMEVYVTGKTPGDLRKALFAAGLKELESGRLQVRPFPTPAGPNAPQKSVQASVPSCGPALTLTSARQAFAARTRLSICARR